MEYGLFERLRGIDKWPLIQATVSSVEQTSEGGRGGSWRRVSFTYRCGSEDFGGVMSVDSYSSTYELTSGDTFDLQYNPKKPSRYFCEEAQSLFRNAGIVIGAVCVLFALFVVVVKMFHL